MYFINDVELLVILYTYTYKNTSIIFILHLGVSLRNAKPENRLSIHTVKRQTPQ